jgi:3-oxo-5-alpha-steroid 4-dehydrogenase 1
VNGTIAWVAMELPSPLILLWAYHSVYPITAPTHYGPRLLVGIYLAHYFNRALASPLRTTSRSPSHIIVLLAGIAFNTLNASLIGTYLGSVAKALGTAPVQLPFGFWFGVLGTLLGWASNVFHDEILLRLRKNPSEESAKWQNCQAKSSWYSVPHGGLYRFISYVPVNCPRRHIGCLLTSSLCSFPNYLSEWCACSDRLASSFSSINAHNQVRMGLFRNIC